MSRYHVTGLLIAEERQRCADLVADIRQGWERFLRERGEDSAVAVLTIIAELEALEGQINNPNAETKTQ